MSEMSEVLRRNTRLFLNCLEGLPAGAGPTRASERTNSIEFVALHLLDVRFLLAAHLGLELRNPYAARLEQARGIDDIEDFPPLDEVIRHWRDVSAAVADRLEGITDEELAEECEQHFPLTGPTRGAGALFLLQHEMYHIGQLALLRKHLGLPAMRWS